ncbi:hypothetical protein L209DRAFT_192256 [Thermothelomyces heterothallicus CBS 203.75]
MLLRRCRLPRRLENPFSEERRMRASDCLTGDWPLRCPSTSLLVIVASCQLSEPCGLRLARWGGGRRGFGWWTLPLNGQTRRRVFLQCGKKPDLAVPCISSAVHHHHNTSVRAPRGFACAQRCSA